ncbi:NADH:ubiquinone oxidoreductase [Pseudomonas sp. CFBP 8771]|uniref:NADH:ubiquinone oxidoreductase n=1 Tax=Pseudomonas sp. CFBP 8771 TaxID=2775285 RepID=UPI00178437E4|nr:NADH:ubiquinone oxidoreductase [Pseudomonas sp. CFBP 8771]MBD8603969.1 NADH:ubiquinone oxidoreductase [Pseudomonas sp. CFBP 8771]
MRVWGLLGLLAITQVWAEACVVHSQAERVSVEVCQQNRTIPPKLFKEGFCRPNLPGQQVEVQFLAQCPQGAYGICRGARVERMPYEQDIHYYGVASDAAYLKPFCEQNSQGQWILP